MIIDFTTMTKNERSDYINTIWSINQLLKQTFLSVYLLKDGKIIEDKLNKLTTGRHYGITSLQEVFPVPDGTNLRIDCERVYNVIKDYKKLIDGIRYDMKDFYVYFIMRDIDDIKFAKMVEPIDIIKYDFDEKTDITSKLYDDEIDDLLDKHVLTKNVDDKYSMIIAHKLFPNMKKSSDNTILIKDIDNRYFTSNFVFNFDATNQSGKKLYSKVTMMHMYKFLKI